MITKENDIYLYFEIIRQLRPASVLDVGMFLSRIGAVSRQAMGCEVPEMVILDGVRTEESVCLPVYEGIYGRIYPAGETWMQSETVYDVGVVLHTSMKNACRQQAIWEYLWTHCGVIVFETDNVPLLELAVTHTKCQEITVDADRYILAYGKAGMKSVKKAVPQSRTSVPGDDLRIYVATHKRFAPPQEKIYIPLHVGREGKEDFGYIGDNTGEHISGKNKSYCELTGMYWMWKNVSCDIIGLCHYRRYFARDGKLLTEGEIRNILSQADIVLGNSSMSPSGSVYQHYLLKHQGKDLEICRQVIQKQCPEYLQAFDCCMGSNLMNIGNMMITRKEIFDTYCEWLFPLLAELEGRTDITGYDTYQARLYGFLAERLLRVWVLNQRFTVREEDVLQTDL
ncbi:MAG: DUF4422 domain-containing protein [Roseburia sp.]